MATPQQPSRPQQLSLFGDVGRAPERPPVAPAALPEDLHTLAAQLPAKLRLGTSSWSFPGWRGLVYAPDAPAKQLARHGLRAYARHPLLRTVGIDRTFYRPIAADEFRAYAEQVPADFRFLVKAWGELTSPTVRGRTGLNPRYLDPECAIDDVLDPAVHGLGDRLGPLLLQFPPQGGEITRAPARFADRLHQFLAALPNGPLYVVELRDDKLLTDHYAAALRATGAQHCYVVHPRMPSIDAQRERVPATGPITARWMLHGGLRYEQAKARYEPFDALIDPDPASRAQLAALCRSAIELDVDMVVVVNNKAEGSSPRSVIELARAIVAGNQPVAPRSTAAS